MEVRARYILIGSFTLAVILGLFTFVYWIKNVGGLGQRAIYQIQFEQPVRRADRWIERAVQRRSRRRDHRACPRHGRP